MPDRPLNPAVLDQGWLRPADGPDAEPRWGHPNGLQLGLHPLPGPRGLLRLYTPYLGQPSERLLNFVAVEPIVAGRTGRGYSELEHSRADDRPGKRFRAERTDIAEVDGVSRLVVDVGVERFDNGADVAVRVEFRADRPHQVSLAAVARPGCAPLSSCVLSATMGNFARLRRLQLADRVVTPDALWPGFADNHFTEHASFGLSELVRRPDGGVEVSATSDEADPAAAGYAPDVRPNWHYVGRSGVQTWSVEAPDPQLRAQVNGRRVYWASRAPIPGGTAFENVELVEPFCSGRAFTFSVEPLDA